MPSTLRERRSGRARNPATRTETAENHRCAGRPDRASPYFTKAGACLIYPACQQMYPGSSFIAQITSGDETPGDTKYATWYSACDGVILPYTSTRLDGATNNNVVCQNHIGYLAGTVVLGQVARFIAS